jgi:hypothetical protein
MIKESIKNELRNNNQLSLKVALRMDIQQGALFRRIERNSDSLFHDIRLLEILKENGFEEVFENETVEHHSLSNN